MSVLKRADDVEVGDRINDGCEHTVSTVVRVTHGARDVVIHTLTDVHVCRFDDVLEVL